MWLDDILFMCPKIQAYAEGLREAYNAESDRVMFPALPEDYQAVFERFSKAEGAERYLDHAGVIRWISNGDAVIHVDNMLEDADRDLTEEEMRQIAGEDKDDALEDVAQLISPILAEAEKLTGQTATALKAQLSGNAKFKGWKDEDWEAFGKYIKGLKVHKSVFTGVLGALIQYLIKNKRGLPATSHYAERKIFGKFQNANISLKDPTGGKAMGMLDDEGIIQGEYVTAKQAINALHTGRDKKFNATNPRAQMYVWFVGDNLRDILKFLSTKKIRIKAESIELNRAML